MSYGGFLYDNAAYDVTPVSDEAATGYPIANAIDKEHPTKHRSTTPKNIIKWDFAAAKALQAVSIHNHNLADGDVIDLLLSANSMVNVITDGGMEAWATATNLTSWTENIVGTSTVNREAASQHGGTYCCRLDIDAGGDAANILQAQAMVANKGYRLEFWYKTTGGATAQFYFYDSGPNVWLKSDATWTGVLTGITLPAAATWTRFKIDFTSNAAYANYVLEFSILAAASQSVYYDDANLFRIDEILNLEPSWALTDLYYAFAATKTYRYVALYIHTANTTGYIEAGEYCLWVTKYQFSKDYGSPVYRRMRKLHRYDSFACGVARKVNLAWQNGFVLTWRQIAGADADSVFAAMKETDIVFVPDYVALVCYHGSLYESILTEDVGMDTKEAFAVTFWQSGIRM